MACFIHFYGSTTCDSLGFHSLRIYECISFYLKILVLLRLIFPHMNFAEGFNSLLDKKNIYIFHGFTYNISYGFCPAYVYVISNENFSLLKGLLQNEVKFVHFFIFEYNDKSEFKSNSSVRYFQDLRRVIET